MRRVPEVRVNRRQLADILGITQPTVTAWADQGMPSVVQGQKGVEWVFETKDCIEWFAQNKVKRRHRRRRRGSVRRPSRPAGNG
jgi:phage terminase Nu1 subunit (DNA packaging protein)